MAPSRPTAACGRVLDRLPAASDDFVSAAYGDGNVDFPVHMAFKSYGYKDTVEAVIRANTILDCWGGDMYHRQKDSSTWGYVVDDGPKECSTPIWNNDDCDTRHIRLYATEPRGFNYSTSSWKYYTLASVHRDVNECDTVQQLNQDHGWGENVEEYFSSLFAGLGYLVTETYDINTEDGRWQSSDAGREEQYFQSDGRLTVVRIPNCAGCGEPPPIGDED